MARNDHPAAAAVQAREEVKNRQVAEYYEREANLQPTPTQAENDLARVGALNHDDKEDDGSEWEADAQARVMQANLSGGPYSTRRLRLARLASPVRKPLLVGAALAVLGSPRASSLQTFRSSAAKLPDRLRRFGGYYA
jgi:hypothetical protein